MMQENGCSGSVGHVIDGNSAFPTSLVKKLLVKTVP